MKTIVGLIAFVALAAIIAPSTAQQKTPFQRLMDMKLEHAQGLLAAISKDDFKSMIDKSKGLVALTEKGEWMKFDTLEYNFYSDEFRRAAKTLIDKAKQKNSDGTPLAYLHLTMTCVRCHQYVRSNFDVRLDGSPMPPNSAGE